MHSCSLRSAKASRVVAALVLCQMPGKKPHLREGPCLRCMKSLEVDHALCRTIGRDPFGDPNCVHISSIATMTNQTYMVVVSDQDDFDAVLPARTVRYISVRPRRLIAIRQKGLVRGFVHVTHVPVAAQPHFLISAANRHRRAGDRRRLHVPRLQEEIAEFLHVEVMMKCHVACPGTGANADT